MNFNPSWLMRAGRADVTTPKLLDARFVATLENCVWLKRVERLQPELQPHLVREREVLEQRQVQVVDARAALGVPPEVAELTWRGLRERRGVEPPVTVRLSTSDRRPDRRGWCRTYR